MKKKYFSFNLKIKSHFLIIVSIFLLTSALAIIPSLTSFNYNLKRIFEITILLISLLLIPFSKVNLFYNIEYKQKIILLSLFILGIASSIKSKNIGFAFIEFITIYSIFIICNYLSLAWKSRYIVFSIFTLFVGFFLLEIKFYAYYLAFIISNNQFSIHDFFPSFGNARFFNQYQIWTLPFLTFILTEQSLFKKINKYFLLYISISWWVLFFTTGSRGAILSVVTALCLVKFFFRDKSSEFIKTTLFVSLSGFTVYQFLFHAIPYLINQDSKLLLDALEIRLQSTTGRLFLWEKAISFSINNPILGVGPMHFAWQDIENTTSLLYSGHPHNSFLQWGAEWGLISLSLISYLTLYSLRKWFTKFNYTTVTNSNAPLAITLTFSVISALTYSLFSGVIVMPMSQLMWIFIISIMIAKYNNELPIKTNSSFYPNFLLIPIALLYFYLLCPQLIEILFHEDTTTIRSYPYPRFWVDGHIF